VSEPACLGLTLQIALMYLGTVLNRTSDRFAYHNLNKCQWLPPKLDAVYYALSGSFASRKWYLTDLIRSTSFLSKFTTLAAMAIEFGCPILCLLLYRKRHVPGSLLCLLHAGLLATVNLPNWQFLGMIGCVTWIPPSAWDALQTYLPPTFRVIVDDHGKKVDDHDGEVIKTDSPKPTKARTVSRAVAFFFLSYMVYNWCGERGWIAKHDGGDIGEFLRFSQYWVMYGQVSTMSVNTIITARLETEEGRHVDVLGALRSGGWGDEMNDWEYSQLREEMAENMTARYPSPRWERALYQWGDRRDVPRARRLCAQLCRIGNEKRVRLGLEQCSHVELVWQHLGILPIDSNARFRKGFVDDTVVRVDC